MAKSKLETLKESRTAAVEALDAINDEQEKALLEGVDLTDDQRSAAKTAETRLADIDTAISRETAAEARRAEFDEERSRSIGDDPAHIRSEPLTYSPANPDNSFVRDLYALASSSPGARGAGDRLMRHMTEVEKLADGPQTSGEARQAARSMQELRRKSTGRERRDVSTSAGSLGDWAPPVFDLDNYAPWRTFGRSFIDQCRTMPLPESGMTVNIPRVTTPTEAVNQTGGSSANENTTIASQDMTGTYGTGNVQTIVSNSLVSQQYLDRFGPAGYSSDQLILRDQTNQVNKLLDCFAWDQVIASVKASNNILAYTDSTFEAQKYKGIVHQAKAALRKTDGIVTYPTHVFTTADVWESVEGAYDSANRPLVVPQGVAFNPIAVGDETNAPEGYTGYRFASLPSFVDQNFWNEWQVDIPATPTIEGYQPTLVADLSQGLEWMEGSPVIRVLPQPYASTLTVLLQQYVYAALVIRYPGMFYVVAGTGTSSANLI